MNPGMVMMFGVEAYIEHGEIEKVRQKYGGVTYRLGRTLRDASRMLNIHPRIHHERVSDPVRQQPEPQGHHRIDPERNGPEREEDAEFTQRSAT